jgi:transposase
LIQTLLKEEPAILSVEVLRRARLEGYSGGKSALFALVANLRPPQQARLMMRFEGLPGEFSQHDFGEVRVRFIDGGRRIVHFFASRLKWSRWVEVTLVDNEVVETLVRGLASHFTRFGGVPLCAVFDRPKTVALHWGDDGVVTEWNPTFAYAALELGFTAEVCWPHQPRQKDHASDCTSLRTCIASFGWMRRSRKRFPGWAVGIGPPDGSQRICPRSSARTARNTPSWAKRFAVEG